ncbi:hypothetical protein E4T38_06633 [Aureobasidium subglaciale]|nr:hypothetical protein E4T38_06633 [Aureobasidium subglaciale]KAI5218065.1 hypothetical protein E4T40_07096 [Aureobasidium subglaciale]KAI5221644.1 hypothetical protein E4T41_07016 [Aureobasidium subglaciale]KAI5259101.1 hypothetical protein E4T46_06994 [Aureobasidium subglaciale]
MYCSTNSPVALAGDHSQALKSIRDEIKECPLPDPKRHLRSTSVYSPMISTRVDASSETGPDDTLSWVKANPTVSTLEPLEHKNHIWQPTNQAGHQERESDIDSDVDVSKLSLTPKPERSSDHCYVCCSNCSCISLIIVSNGQGCLSDVCTDCGACGVQQSSEL